MSRSPAWICGAMLLTAGLPPAPEPPRAHVDVALPTTSGRTLAVRPGGDLQAALDRARLGDVIVLEPGATYRGPFTLPSKDGAGWIVITTGGTAGVLGEPGRRAGPKDATAMAKLVSDASPVVSTAPGAHHYRLIGLELRPAPGAFLYNVVDLSAPDSAPEAMPHHIVLDRCFIHGDPARGGRRGVALNGRFLAVVDSHLSDFKESGADSQAVAGWNGPGPFLLSNDHLEAAGENVMFGGADPTIPDLVPSDIEVRRNLIIKPLSWKEGEPDYAGASWTVKNLLELKNARRVVIDGNVLDTTWAAAQVGFAVLFTVRNEGGTAPWSTVEDVAFTRNLVRHAGGGINILGRDDSGGPSQRTSRIVIRNNLFLDIGGPRWGGRGTLFQMLNGTADVVIERNTAEQRGPIVFADGPPHEGWVFRRNLAPNNDAGISGSGTKPGLDTLGRYFPGATVRENVIIGAAAGLYPPGNAFPPARETSTIAANFRYAGIELTDLLEGLGRTGLPP
jgi:hypothetical protein